MLAAVLPHWIRDSGRPLHWATAHSIGWDLSSAEAHGRTDKVEATIDLVKTAATKMAYPDAADTIPDLFTWASAAHIEMFTRSGAKTVGQFPGSRPSADEVGDASGFSGRAQHANADIRSTVVRGALSSSTVSTGSLSVQLANFCFSHRISAGSFRVFFRGLFWTFKTSTQHHTQTLFGYY